MMRRPARTSVAGVLLASAVPLVPAVAYVTAAGPAPAAARCAAPRSGTIAARGNLADPAGLEAGTFWWQPARDGHRICAGMVQMWLRYPRREPGEWLAAIYRGPAEVSVIADRDYVMNAGWHALDFTIRPGPAGSICLAARFGRGHTGALARSCAGQD